MKYVYAYIRVSTVRQGEKGSSLREQREAILAYARRHELDVLTWFEEMETAAKSGRREFNRMLNLLRRGKADGVILHKIDRGARNLMDWARLCELSDRGLVVHSVSENVDLLSTHGRLSADIQAAVAASYVRNLRDEVKKGLYGRLKQGLYPLGAPIGYLDKGGGKLKEVDPLMGPLMRLAFERYASGSVSLALLAEEMHVLGLRTKRGGRVHKSRLSVAFTNPFYIGLMRIKKTDEVFQGAHQPLVTKSLFDKVQAVLHGKVHAKTRAHAFIFRRLIWCGHCDHVLTGELQKGRVYYRCHTKACLGASAREDAVERMILTTLSYLRFDDAELEGLRSLATIDERALREEQARKRRALELVLANIGERLNRLTDAYIDRLIEKDLFESRKHALLLERASLRERIANVDINSAMIAGRLNRLFEQVQSMRLSYEMGFLSEKREIVESVTSNFSVKQRDVVVKLRSPYREIFEWRVVLSGEHDRTRFRTRRVRKLFQDLWKHFSNDNDECTGREVA